MKKTLLFLLALNCAIMLQAQNELDFIEEARQNLSVPMLGVVGGPGGNGNGVVGAIGGVVDVGGLGAATYTIPLELPEGIGGVQPSLSVTYNSQSGNGLLGWGWTLGGLSAISRVGKNLFLDGQIKGVNFNNDCFALDGQRLIKTGGTYWSDGIEYRTEVDGMSRIVSYSEDSIVHGPAKFKVWTSNGFIMEYGYTPDSKIAYKCKNDTTKYEVALWLLNKVQDRDGNYMKYEYGKGGAHYCVKKISYTGNADAGFYPRYLITFDYGNNPEARRDTETTFIGNHTLHQARLLESISIQWCVYNPWSFEEIARYDFDYLEEDAQQGLYYHRLDGITYSKDGIQYNKTTVDWGNNDYSTNPENFITAVTTGNGNAFANKVKFTGDFNGDGFKDILVVYKNSSRKYAAVYLNDGIINGNSSFHFHQEIELDTYTESIHVADLDGDGRDDMVTVSREPAFLKKKVKIFPFLTKWLGQDWMLDYAEKLWTEDDLYISSGHAANLMLGDFLGNGKTEMVMQIPDGSLVDPQLLYITYLGNNQFSMTRSYSQLMYGSVFTAADFNGDGITEIWCDGQVNKNNDDETGAPERANAAMYKMTSHYNVTQFNTDYVLSNNHHLLLGDFNGDGKCDMLSYVEESKNADSTRTSYRWKINYFMESELFWNAFDITDELPYIDPERHSFGLFDSPWDHTDYQYYEVTDMDGDGKSDFVVQSGNYLYIYFGPLIRTGIESARFSYKKILNLYDIGLGSIVSKMTLCAGSFLGRENAGIMGNSSIFSLFPMTNRYSVSTITDGMGNKTEFEYDYLTTFNSDIYSWSKSFDEPEYDIFSVPFSMKALKKVSSSNPIASTPVTSTKYHYRDAYVHRKGKGVLGFRLTASASYINGQRFDSVVSSYSTVPLRAHRALAFDHRWMYNAMNRLTLQEDYTNGFMEYHSNSHVYVPLVKIKHASSFNPDNNMEELLSVAITENEYQIDFAAGNNGGLGYYSNTLKLTDTYEGMSDWWQAHAVNCPHVTHTETFYRTENLQSTWIINRPDSTVVTSWKTGDPFISKSLITYSYRDNTTYHPSKIKSYPGGNLNNANGLATMTAYEYDAVGNVTSETLAALSGTPSGHTTSYTYQDHRLRATETNALGYVTQSHYDPKYGEILYGADCNGQTTYYNHSDHLGSSEWVRYPDMTYGCTAKRWARRRMNFYDPDSPSQAAYYTWKRISGEAPVKAFYDAAGREMRTVTYGLHGDTIYQDTEYNSLGLVLRKSLPYFKSDTRQWTSYYYDGLLRLQATYQPDGTYTTVEYSGLSTTTTFHTTDQTTRTSRVTNNYLGQKIRSVDAFGTEVTYVYYPDGKLKYTQVGNNTDTRINLEYDDAGNRTKIYDPNYGEVVETYDAFGQLLSTRSPKNDMTTYQYDVLGRCISRLETDNAHLTSVQTSWTYSETTGQKGLLQQISYGNNQEIIYNYDATHLNRLISMKERLFGDDYMTYYTYDDSDGFPLRVHSVTYPTGYATCNVYDLASGQRYKIEDGQNNTLWETLEMNALGQVTRYSLGNGVMSHRSFDPNTGRLHGIGSSNGQNNLQNLGYEWDDFGNLAARYDKTKDLMETFGYDALDRLTDISLNDVPTGHMTYDIFGRMTSKQTDGQAVFSSAQYDFVGLDGQLRPHAVSSAEMVSNPFPTQGLGLDYTMFDKVLQITWPSNNSIQFDYGYDHQRIRSLTSHGLSPITKTYIGNCEKIHTAPVSDVYRTYLSGPLGVFAVVEQVANTENITYILKDHLGSWSVFTDEDGDLVREESFDAWGNRRNAATWTGTATGSLLFDRGFTGHEHIESIGLINMNGRLYDPVMSTFLSVDNYVQEPDFSQNFNRYAYCLNNPLKYTDPDGESITLLAAVAISAAVSVASTLATNVVYDRPLYEGLGKAAAMGALQGMFSFGIGTAAGIIGNAIGGTWGTVAQTGFQVLAHGTLGGISTEARGGKFWHGFASGAVASFVSTITGVSCKEFHVPDSWTKAAMVAAGGLSGGVSASMAGGDFWEGMCNGLICSGLNHAMHLACGPDDPPGSGSANNKKNETTKQTFTNVGEAGGGIATAVDGAASKATMKTLSLTSKVLGGAFVVVSEIPDLLIAWNDPSLGNVTKVVVGSVLGAATVFAGPVVATGAFVLGVVNAYGGFDEGYDYLNNMKTNNR